MPQREAVFTERHPVETMPNLSWHLQAFRDVGYAEAGIIWRGARDAAVAALTAG